jgi:hypothetical protein
VLGDGGDEDGGDDDGGVGVFDAASGAGAGSGAGTGSGAGAGTGSGLGGGGSLCTAAVLAAVVGGVVMAGAEGGAVVGTGFVSDCAGLSVSFITAVTDPKPTRSAATHASGSKTARVPILEAKERPPSRSAAGSIDSRGGPSPCRSGALSRSAGGSVGEPSGSCGAIGAVASFPGATFRLTCEIATIALSPTASVVKPIVGPLFTQISVVKVVPSGSPREEIVSANPPKPFVVKVWRSRWTGRTGKSDRSRTGGPDVRKCGCGCGEPLRGRAQKRFVNDTHRRRAGGGGFGRHVGGAALPTSASVRGGAGIAARNRSTDMVRR